MFDVSGKQINVFNDVVDAVIYFFNKENGNVNYPHINSLISLMDKDNNEDSKNKSETCFGYQLK